MLKPVLMCLERLVTVRLVLARVLVPRVHDWPTA
jgi:hypothetical protein